jgi:hypothetical protein
MSLNQILEAPRDKQTELMLKYGPKDTCWAANWGENDQPLLEKYFIKSATLGLEDNPMVIEFFDQLENKWNDHKGVLQIDGQTFEIIDIAKTKDIPTVQGLQWCCKRIINPGLGITYRYHGVGSDNREPRAYQQRLYGETEPRADMTIPAKGSITRVNQSIRAIGIFPIDFPTITVRESAIFTNVTVYTGIMLNRQVFTGGGAGVPIVHTVNVAPFTVATDINFASVTTWL